MKRYEPAMLTQDLRESFDRGFGRARAAHVEELTKANGRVLDFDNCQRVGDEQS